MNTILQNNYVHISHHSASSLMTISYFPATEYMTEDEWKELMMEILEQIKSLKIRILLSDNRQMLFVITLELQTWFAKAIYKYVQNGNLVSLEKFALVMPKELIAELSVEQTIDESKALKMVTPYIQRPFSDIAEAEKWLLE
jgi:hypothetical protein